MTTKVTKDEGDDDYDYYVHGVGVDSSCGSGCDDDGDDDDTDDDAAGGDDENDEDDDDAGDGVMYS